MSIENDKDFERLINGTWNLRGTKVRVVEGGKQNPYLRSGTESAESPFDRSTRESLVAEKKNMLYPSPKQEENFAVRASLSSKPIQDSLK